REAMSGDSKERLGGIIARRLGEEADRIGLSRGAKMFRNVSGHLEELQPHLVGDAPYPAMIAHLQNETLPKLKAELHGTEGKPQYAKLRPWLESMVAELNDVATRASAMRAESLAMEFSLAAPVGAGKSVVGATGVVKAIQGDQFTNVVAGLMKPRSIPPANALQLKRRVDVAFQPKADTGIQLAGTFREDLRASLPVAVANTKVTPDVGIKVYALRAKAALFGHNAPRQPVPVPHTEPTHFTLSDEPSIGNTWGSLIDDEGELTVVALDAVYDQITPGSLVAIDHPPLDSRESRVVEVRMVEQTQPTTLEVVSMATKVSVLTLENAWLDSTEMDDAIGDPSFLRGTTVYAQSEELPLAEEPIDDPICGSNDASDPNALIELDSLYS